MGGLLSRSKKKEVDTFGVLEELTKEIDRLEEKKKSDVENQKRTITSLVVYSVVLYGVIALIWYFCFAPDTWVWKFIYSLPLLIFPIIIVAIKKILHWVFVKRIRGDEVQLEGLKERRKQILDEVMEKETYKKAKDILARFGPERITDVDQPIPEDKESDRESSVRKRNVASSNVPAAEVARPQQSLTPNQQQHSWQRMPIRPILKRERTIMDRLVDYLLVDGPQNRYALVCKECHSHNGMALQEEFEYLSFRCVYCSAFNPCRKQKPVAPRLTPGGEERTDLQRPQEKSEEKLDGETQREEQPKETEEWKTTEGRSEEE